MSDAKAVEGVNPDNHQVIDNRRGDPGATSTQRQGGWDVDGYDHFLQQHHHRLLTSNDEVRLIGDVRRGEQAAENHRHLTGDALASRRLLRQVERGRASRHELITHNLRLVAGVVRRYNVSTTPGLDPDDLFQEGVLGLDRAVDLYDPRKSRFSTYATQWIRQRVGRVVDEQSRTVRVPVYRCREHQRVWSARERLAVGGTAPTLDQIAQLADLPVESVKRIEVEAMPIASLDRTNAHDQRLSETLATDEGVPFDEELTTSMLITEVVSVLERPRERDVVLRRNGIVGERETLEAIGNSLGVTRERARQIEHRALERIRRRLAVLPEHDREAFRIWAE